MKAHAGFRPGQEREHRGKAGQKLHIDHGVDVDLACAQDCAKGTDGECERTFGRNGNDVLLRNDFHHVENEAIVLKHDEVDVLASNHSRRATDCRISEDGGALLRELDKENPSDSTGSWWTRCLKDFSEKRQDCAKRDANPPIGVLQSRDAYGEIHVLKKCYSPISLLARLRRFVTPRPAQA